MRPAREQATSTNWRCASLNQVIGSSPAARRSSATRDSEYWRFMPVPSSLVSVVDDDESVRESLPDLLQQFGFAVRAFSSAEDFLLSDCVDQTDCLIADVAMPGMSGPELYRELRQRQRPIPTIFITARRDDAMRSELLAQGAVAWLFKPFSENALLDALHAALPPS